MFGRFTTQRLLSTFAKNRPHRAFTTESPATADWHEYLASSNTHKPPCPIQQKFHELLEPLKRERYVTDHEHDALYDQAKQQVEAERSAPKRGR